MLVLLSGDIHGVLIPYQQGSLFRLQQPMMGMQPQFVLIPYQQGSLFRLISSLIPDIDMRLNPLSAGKSFQTGNDADGDRQLMS